MIPLILHFCPRGAVNLRFRGNTVFISVIAYPPGGKKNTGYSWNDNRLWKPKVMKEKRVPLSLAPSQNTY